MSAWTTFLGSAPGRATSLESRLLLRLGTLYLAALVILAVLYLALAWSNRHVEVEDNVDDISALIAGTLRVDANGQIGLGASPELEEALNRFRVSGLAVIDRDSRRVVANIGSPPMPLELPPGVVSQDQERDSFVRLGGHDMIYSALRTIDTPIGNFWVALERHVKPAADARAWLKDEVLNELLPILAPLLAATLFVTWVTLRTTFHPLRRLAEDADRIAEYVPGERLRRERVPSEVLPVVNAANLAIERVETALHAQRRLMANIAHELRTPLAILRARIESLTDPAVAVALLPDFERAASLVDRLLAVARLQAEQVPFDTRYELVGVVRRCLAQMAPLAIAQQKELALTAPETPLYVRGNPLALEDALRNLVDNALRYTPPGETVELTVQPGCIIDVRDRGPGVPAEAAERLFEPFWRGTENGGAAGLGLAIAAETAKRHGGRLRIANAGSGGAVFRLEIPESA